MTQLIPIAPAEDQEFGTQNPPPRWLKTTWSSRPSDITDLLEHLHTHVHTHPHIHRDIINLKIQINKLKIRSRLTNKFEVSLGSVRSCSPPKKN